MAVMKVKLERRLSAGYRPFVILISLVVIVQVLQIIYMERYYHPDHKRMRTDPAHGVIQLQTRDLVKEEHYVGRCRIMTSPFGQNLTGKQERSDMKDWTFTKKRNCDEFILVGGLSIRTRVELDCTEKVPVMRGSLAYHSDDVHSVSFGDACLSEFIDNCCIDENPVPNVVHYVWYTDKELGYFNFLSLMSVIRFQKPCLILIHGPFVPHGSYWDHVMMTSPNIVHVNRERPTEVFGNTFRYKEHASDVMRIEALMEYGGIYLDFDEILLRPLHSLRRFEYTQGRELKNTMGSQLVISKKNATFLHLWYRSYKNDYRKIWAYNALWVPNNLAKQHPDLIHVEGYNFTRPNWQNTKQIFEHNYDWRTNYAMHMYARWYKRYVDPELIRTLNTTVGSVSRHVLLGNKELCKN